MLLNNGTIILIENASHCLRVYYADGHSELVKKDLSDFAILSKVKSGYKNPIQIGDDFLYPTKNKRDKDCCYVNLKCFDYHNDYFIELLKTKNLLEKSKKEYLHHKLKAINSKKDGSFKTIF